MTFLDIIYLLCVSIGGFLGGVVLAELVLYLKNWIENELKDPFE